MTVSVRRMSAGTGYRYLLASVAVGDAGLPASNSMTRYYSEPGNPPGRWAGAGLAGLDGGRGLAAGTPVREEQLFRLLGMGMDPVSQAPLGSAPRRANLGYREGVRARLSALPIGLPKRERPRRVQQIETEERSRCKERASSRSSAAVAAFDLTMSVPKSVSAVWAVADARIQEMILQAHRGAVADALAWAEREVFATRIGRGGAEQVGVRGVIAAMFEHVDSRANDPHLHTHLVIANRVQTSLDDKWRTLDSRSLFRAVVALSELHQGLLMDRITSVLGVGWDGRARLRSPVPQWEITGVPDELRREFSRRSGNIEAEKDRLVAAYVDLLGRVPSAATVLKLRQQATLQTRPDKQLHSLAELTEQWRARARHHVGADPTGWAATLPQPHCVTLRPNEWDAERVRRLAEQTLAAVAEKRATFTRWNVFAEAQRQLHATRLAGAADRAELGDRVTDSALGLAMLLTAPEDMQPAHAVDGRAPARANTSRYTTRTIFDAEERLLAAARDTGGPALDPHALGTGRTDQTAGLSAEQRTAVEQIVTSGRGLDVLVGAAGTGKTTTMAVLAGAWRARFGAGAVIGLAPSAAAADVLGTELNLPTENTVMWLTQSELEPKRLARLTEFLETRRRLPHGSARAQRVEAAARTLAAEIDRWRLKPDQLVIIDEASLAGTITLDRIVIHARHAQAKVLLVGDWAQLAAVDAGGAFGMLAHDRPDVAELLDVHRFTEAWEKTASLDLRVGDPAVISTYADHGRLHDGDRAAMINAAYTAWSADQQAGRRSLLLAADTATVTDLNHRARNDLVLSGRVSDTGVSLADGTAAGVGDRIVTRRNDRNTTTGNTWVKNGDEWTVVRAEPGEGLEVQRLGGSARAHLSADYVHDHVELAYATTAHRAEGRTVDTAHAIVTGPPMTREALYVVMTRGRHVNHAYIATDHVSDGDTAHGADDARSPKDLLRSVLNNIGAEQSAHQIVQGSPKGIAPKHSRPGTLRPTDWDHTFRSGRDQIAARER